MPDIINSKVEIAGGTPPTQLCRIFTRHLPGPRQSRTRSESPLSGGRYPSVTCRRTTRPIRVVLRHVTDGYLPPDNGLSDRVRDCLGPGKCLVKIRQSCVGGVPPAISTLLLIISGIAVTHVGHDEVA